MNRESDTLIERLQRGNRTCFDDIVAWYSTDILRLCYMLLRSREEAEDTMQESLLKFVKSVQEGRIRSGNGSIKSYILKIARNLCIDKLRRKHIQFTSLDEDNDGLEFAVQDTQTPAQVANEVFFFSAFENALAQLTDIQRTILVLRELNQESYKEIAEGLNITVESVKKQLFRGRRKLRLLLSHYRGEL